MTKYSCVTPFWDTVTCELDISGCPKEECIYSLTFHSEEYGSHQVYLIVFYVILLWHVNPVMFFLFILPTMISSESETCPLAWIGQSYRCDCKITSDKFLSQNDKYVISLCSESAVCQQLTNNFIPHLNSKLDLIKIVVSMSCL